MKTIFKIFMAGLLMMSFGCVQKTYNRTVLFQLNVKGINAVKTVGIRGNDKPLNWENDFPMQLDPKDSLYKATVTWKTGYLFSEYKFVVNGTFEPIENRRIQFDSKDTITSVATFGKS